MNSKNNVFTKPSPERDLAITKLINTSDGDTAAPIRLTRQTFFDGKAVYFTGFDWVLDNADPYTISELVGSRFIADKKSVWYEGKPVDVDRDTFEVLGGVDGIYALDKNHVYCQNFAELEVVPHADPSTFRDLDFSYGADAHNVFCGDTILADVVGKYKVDRCGFLVSETSVYHYSFRLPVDALTFKVVNYDEKLKETNPFLGKFLIEDKNGSYQLSFQGEKHAFENLR